MKSSKKPSPRRRARGDNGRRAGAAASRSPLRLMTIVAQDPSVRRASGEILMATVSVPAEDLIGGPVGYRVHVVDYDSTIERYHGAHTLPATYEDEPRAWVDGKDSLVSDFRFHAQNAYALVMKTLARFEFALGRRLGWSFHSHQLKVAPHGMMDANAFYSPADEGLVFGYFSGQKGQTVYTSLSHDIVVHEATHALLDCLRERYMYPSGPDQAAFHEGFGDVVALLSVFSLPEVVEHLLQPTNGPRRAVMIKRDALTADALRESALFGLAEEMGSEIEGVRGSPLRHSVTLKPDPTVLDTDEFLEPHRRGEVFVAAVMNAFVEAWAKRIRALGTANQQTYPLAAVVEEGADIADTMATMWIRALDYMPPVHLEFGDALSAVLTADLEVRPDDSRFNLRTHLTNAFAPWGITPASARSQGIWSAPPAGLRYDRVRADSMRTDKDEVFRFLWDNRKALQLREGAFTQVISVRPCTRIGPDGFVLRETVVEYYQVARLTPKELKARGITAPEDYLAALDASRQSVATAAATDGDDDAAPRANGDDGDDVTPVYGGAVLIFDEYGHVKYWVHKDVFGDRQSARLEYLWEEGYLVADRGTAKYRPARFSSIHLRRAVDATRRPSEGW
jgi:hypothetical protein